MKKILTLLLLILFYNLPSSSSERKDSVLIVFWNLENFFDYMDQGGGDSDKEFSSFGSRHWNKKRFFSKCDAVAKTIFHLSGRYGRMPDVIGLAEIENRQVLSRLVGQTLLRKHGYGIIHFESSDRRGIDVAILYRKNVFTLSSTSIITPEYNGKLLNTRDIIHAELLLASGGSLDVIVNHHPSKYGGADESDYRRTVVMKNLRILCDSLDSDNIIAMGDFNDTPDAPQFRIMDDILINKSIGLYERGEGTIRYEGRWELIDMFLVSPELDSRTYMEICKVPFLMTWDRKHPGYKPLRTYSGPRYSGGVSDHLPIVMKVFL